MLKSDADIKQMNFNFSEKERRWRAQRLVQHGEEIEGGGGAWNIVVQGAEDALYAQLVGSGLFLEKYPRWTALVPQGSDMVPGDEPHSYRVKVRYAGKIRARLLGKPVTRVFLKVALRFKVLLPRMPEMEARESEEGYIKLESIQTKLAQADYYALLNI